MGKRMGLALSALMGIVAGTVMRRREVAGLRQEIKDSGKFPAMFYMMNQWVRVNQDGKSIVSYFEKHKYKKIAVYGMNTIGETLVNELKDTGVEVVYGIDRRAGSMHTNADIDIVSPDGPFGNVDAVVVTAIDYLEEIEEKLREKVECPIISLENVIFEV